MGGGGAGPHPLLLPGFRVIPRRSERALCPSVWKVWQPPWIQIVGGVEIQREPHVFFTGWRNEQAERI